MGVPMNTQNSLVERAVEDIRAGKMVIVSDDEDREREGDLIIAASRIGAGDVNLMAREGRGLICCAIDEAIAERLDLGVQADARRPALHGTAFTESVDAREGTTTGISAADRAITLRALADPASRPADLARPGHIFPIVPDPVAYWSATGTRRRPWTSAASLAFRPPASSARSCARTAAWPRARA